MKRLPSQPLPAPSAVLRPTSERRVAVAVEGSVADAIARILQSNGVVRGFGIVGGAVAPLCEALERCSIELVHFRHETGAAFAAMEAYFVDGHPVALFTTTGPGLINALNGVIASRWEGAQLIVVSGTTPVGKRGRWAFQEASAYTFSGAGLYNSGPIFHYATEMHSAAELPEIAARLANGLARRNGFVAHIAVPIDLQTKSPEAIAAQPVLSHASVACPPTALADIAARLSGGPFVIWVGFGARLAAPLVKELAERSGAMVMCSPRAKGIFPERHPQFIGVTGFGGHASVVEYMRKHRPNHVLVLGSRLGEFTSFWDDALLPRDSFIHVDLDPEVPGVAYPEANTVSICAEISEFMTGLLKHMPGGTMPHESEVVPRPHIQRPVPRSNGKVRPQLLMSAIQSVLIDRSDALILTEAGNAFAWANHHLQFHAPHRYRVSVGYGSMGNAVTGVVGAALAREGKAFAFIGDGAMLMFSEVSTAVHLRAQAVWIVLNDARYGMIAQGMRAQGLQEIDTAIPACNFVEIARGMGADGVRVERETDVVAALEMGLAAPGPFVIDVVIDPNEQAPFLRRIESLIQQGARPHDQ